jgi:hypothetical protein
MEVEDWPFWGGKETKMEEASSGKARAREELLPSRIYAIA